MVQILAGEKGEGKTKKLIDMANERVRVANGNVVYIDDDSRHMYDLKHTIRFVEVAEFPLANYREFIGFVYGIFSQNSDIETIFVDGMFKIINNLPSEDIIKLMAKLTQMSEKYNVDFIIAANIKATDLPVEVSDLIMK